MGLSPGIHSPDNIFQGGIEGQFDQPDFLHLGEGLTLAEFLGTVGADCIHPSRFHILFQAAVIAQTTLDLWKKVYQAANCCAFPRSTRADQEHSTQIGIEERKQQSQFHLVLTNQGQKRKGDILCQSGIFHLLVNHSPDSGSLFKQFLE
jgi:hypothetical protein